MNQTWENGKKKLILVPILVPLAQIWARKKLLWILPLLDVTHCRKLSLYEISRKTYQPNLWTWQKKLVSGPILAQIRADNLFFFFFSKICQSLDITASYNHVQYKKKLMNQSWENLVTDGRADGQ